MIVAGLQQGCIETAAVRAEGAIASATGVSLGRSMTVTAPDTPQLRKSRGAFFTPPEVVDFIVSWAIRGPNEVVLEPSCGEAEFMLSAGHRLRALGANGPLADRLRGVEVHEPSAAEAHRLLGRAGLDARIDVSDFFAVDLVDAFDVVVGNPPYVRYQEFTGADRARAQQAAFRAGVKLTGLASSWAAFVVHASQLLTPAGRLGLVLPAELLSVNYAAEVRRYLMERFARVELVMFDERVFPGVIAEVVLLLADGEGPTNEIFVKQVRNLAELDEPGRVAYTPAKPEEKWTAALLPEAILTSFSRAREIGFGTLDDWGDTDLGSVTGRNNFFALTAAEIGALQLPPEDLTQLSPPGSRHLREPRLTRARWEELSYEGAQTYLFYPRLEDPSAEALRYIAHGEDLGVHEGYKCRVRTPWWRVPGVEYPDLFVTCMNHDAPRLVENAARVACLNSVHGLTLNEPLRELGRRVLPLAALNTVTLLGAELMGRSYGGGILKVEPREADRLPIPTPSLLEAVGDQLLAIEGRVRDELVRGQLASATRLIDRIILHDALALTEPDVQRLRDGRDAMFTRRATRGGKAA